MGGRNPGNVEERIARPMTADAAQAYADYVALGRDRSLRKLAAEYAGSAKGSPKLRQLQKWSAEYGWPERIARPIVAEADAAVTDVSRDRMQVYRNCMAELLQRTAPQRIAALDTRELVQIVDRVKPAEADVTDTPRKRYRIVEFSGEGGA